MIGGPGNHDTKTALALMKESSNYSHEHRSLSRRAFLKAAGATASIAATAELAGPGAHAADPPSVPAAKPAPSPAMSRETYDSHAKGIRIVPGQWRPHYPWEHIVWISPAWPSQDYLWLDFPEAIFSNQGLLYLSHVNPPFPVLFPDLPKVEWRQEPTGLAFERALPNGIRFGGSVTRGGETAVELELHIQNGSTQPLKDITLQTCAFLRGIKEFSEFTRNNKFIHAPGKGWVPLSETAALPEGTGPYRVGWRKSGKLLADWPVMVTVSNQAERLVAMTWRKNTLSLVSNPNHPCMHADPQFQDLPPGEGTSIRGQILFFDGKLADFDYTKHFGG